MVEDETPIIEFQGKLEDCVLLVKHPLNESIHSWYAYGKFAEWLELEGQAPLYDEDGQIIGHTSNLLYYVSSVYENLLHYEGESLLVGVADIDTYSVRPPTDLFTSVAKTTKGYVNTVFFGLPVEDLI